MHLPIGRTLDGMDFRTMNAVELTEELNSMSRWLEQLPLYRQQSSVPEHRASELVARIALIKTVLPHALPLPTNAPEYPRSQNIQPITWWLRGHYDEYSHRCRSTHHDHECDMPANHKPPCHCACQIIWTRATANTGFYGDLCTTAPRQDYEI